MILTPIDAGALPALLSSFAASLGDADARLVFARIAGSGEAARAKGRHAAAHHREAVALALAQGMEIIPASPASGVSWDGRAVRAHTEPYVLIHEVAHFQLASPERRRRIDFGLGPGPETGDRSAADRDAVLFGLAREREEASASLLGILWEAALRQPALASFLDQNWLEGAGRPGAARHFTSVLHHLRAGGFLDAAFRPVCRLRQEPDPLPYDKVFRGAA